MPTKTASPAPTAPVTYSFVEVDVPTPAAKVLADNPFASAIEGLLARWDDTKGGTSKALTFVVSVDELVKVRRLIGLAANAHNVSAIQRDAPVKGSLTKVNHTFWLVSKIVRVRTPEAIARAAERKAAKVTV